MSPKEKAKELYQKMLEAGDAQGDFVYDASAKASALIAVNEILSIDLSKPFQEENYLATYWFYVKQEIEKL